MKTLTFDQKKTMADNWLSNQCGLSWDDLGDINSLHDADTWQEILDLCKERLEDASFPMSMLDD